MRHLKYDLVQKGKEEGSAGSSPFIATIAAMLVFSSIDKANGTSSPVLSSQKSQ